MALAHVSGEYPLRRIHRPESCTPQMSRIVRRVARIISCVTSRYSRDAPQEIIRAAHEQPSPLTERGLVVARPSASRDSYYCDTSSLWSTRRSNNHPCEAASSRAAAKALVGLSSVRVHGCHSSLATTSAVADVFAAPRVHPLLASNATRVLTRTLVRIIARPEMLRHVAQHVTPGDVLHAAPCTSSSRERTHT